MLQISYTIGIKKKKKTNIYFISHVYTYRKDKYSYFSWIWILSLLSGSLVNKLGAYLINLKIDHWIYFSLQVLFLFVVFEHILLLLRYVLVYCISDKPQWVRVALAKLNYQSRQALKNQVSLLLRLSSR